MLEMGGLHWDQNTAISAQEALIATPIPATYIDVCNLLHAVSNNLEPLKARKKRDVKLPTNAPGNATKLSSTTLYPVTLFPMKKCPDSIEQKQFSSTADEEAKPKKTLAARPDRMRLSILLYRMKDMSLEDFNKYWANEHERSILHSNTLRTNSPDF